MAAAVLGHCVKLAFTFGDGQPLRLNTARALGEQGPCDAMQVMTPGIDRRMHESISLLDWAQGRKTCYLSGMLQETSA